MRSDEVEEVDDDEVLGPEPPRRGTVAYQRVVLGILSADGPEEFHARMKPVWQWVGWRLGLDVMTELLYRISIAVPPDHHARDAFGQIRISALVHVFTDEEVMEQATHTARRQYGDLPSHEAFRKSMGEWEEVIVHLREYTAYWQEAINAMETARRPQAAAPVLLRRLSSSGDRMTEIARAADLAHASLRKVALPPGGDWVEPALARETPAGQVSGSQAFYRDLDYEQELALVPQWLRDRPPPEAPARKRKKKRRCPGCGREHD